LIPAKRADGSLETTYPVGTFNYSPAAGPGHAFVIDPLGTAAAQFPTAIPNAEIFPYGLYTAASPFGMEPTNSYSVTDAGGNPWVTATAPAIALPGQRWPIRRVTIPANTLTWINYTQPTMSPAMAGALCRLQDDVALEQPKESDHPGLQRWSTLDPNGTPNNPADDMPLSRQFAGNYSWLATVVPLDRPIPALGTGVYGLQPVSQYYGSQRYDVSVAVFYKRNDPTPSVKSERGVAAELIGDHQLAIYAANSGQGADAVDNALEGVGPGQWLAVAGVNPNNGLFLLKWYRLLSLDDETSMLSIGAGTVPGRLATLDGPDWPIPVNPATGAQIYPIPNLRAIIVPGVIGVSTHVLHMEPSSFK
jgi:hypothetical protein